MKFYKLYTDGSYQPDVNIAGIGGYLLDPDDNCIYEFSKPIIEKNLFKSHESLALVHGLEKALELGITHLDCYSDDISFRNVLNNETLSEYSYKNNPYRKHIFELKQQFSHIQFNYIPRTDNKKADKLAGKILRIYKEETLPNRTRQDFANQSDNLLHIPQIICEEDFEHQHNVFNSFKNIFRSLEESIESLQHHYVVEIKKTAFTRDNIDDNNPVMINVYYVYQNQENDYIHQLVVSEKTIQKKLISKGLEALSYSLDKFQEYNNQLTVADKINKPCIGLHFHADNQPLQKLEMLLRKRGILPIPNTPLTKKLVDTASYFDSIVLHNNKNLIQNVLSQNNHKVKLTA